MDSSDSSGYSRALTVPESDATSNIGVPFFLGLLANFPETPERLETNSLTNPSGRGFTAIAISAHKTTNNSGHMALVIATILTECSFQRLLSLAVLTYQFFKLLFLNRALLTRSIGF
mmetsp:Transcript_4218/g.10013  ORF Transcript_4218/g.10013 Transcript_4218/m.10013 type:complete len:117 (+) Transcript_4218:2601-2951(+)